MSVVIAIKENGVIYLGADSQSTKGGTRMTLSNPNNYKIWTVDECDNCLMGHVGSVREGQIVHVNGLPIDELDVLHKAIDWKFVVKYIVPCIFKEVKTCGCIEEKDTMMDSSYLFAYQDNVYAINCDGTVLQVDDYFAIGSGANEAMSSLASTEGLDPETRITKAIIATSGIDNYVSLPIIQVNTKDMEYKVITELESGKKVKKNDSK